MKNIAREQFRKEMQAEINSYTRIAEPSINLAPLIGFFFVIFAIILLPVEHKVIELLLSIWLFYCAMVAFNDKA